jgi:serine/threonine-protein kinase
MKNKEFRIGQKIGSWTLQEYLGGGGNGDVWKCSGSQSDNGKQGAIKLLKKVKPKPYSRFLDEVKVIRENSDIPGIIPMMDSYLPEEIKGAIPYYVMPVAKNAENCLKGKSLEEKIEAILEIGETLKELHNRSIAHRDIKPSNLLKYNSRYYLVDFGLVDYPDKNNISATHEEIGAKWTMAPEMRREPSKADPLKADIYSLAKTLWIILAERPMGFDGQYLPESILGFNRIYRDCYTTPIDRLLTSSTDNDPNSRPSIDNFISKLEEWKTLNKDFHKRNLEQWFEIQKKLFPTAFPKRVIWENKTDIISVLKLLTTYDNLNHMFFPNRGGMDLEDVRLSYETDCIELDFELIDIVKPKRLIFECFSYDPEWNYFRLELHELQPSGVSEIEENQEPDESEYLSEDVTEISPGYYDKFDLLENREEYEDLGYEIPSNARQVTRWLKGSFVIFNKRSPYNLDPQTYDARHNKMDTDEFRNYIDSQVNNFKKFDRKKSSS